MKPDYDFSGHIKVPDEWIKRALSVPSSFTVKSAPVLPLRRIVAAASVMLIAALSITLYFLFGNKNGIPQIQPSPASESAVPSENILPTYPTTSPTVIPTASTAPTEPSSPTEPPASEAPTESFTVPPAEVPSAHPDPIIIPTDEPPEPPTAEETAPPFYPDEPTVLVIRRMIPVEAVDVTAEDQEVDDSVYCTVYDSADRALLSADPYAADHRALRYDTAEGNVLYFECTLPLQADAPEPPYRYIFYTASGATLAEGYLE
jgi:hypothetical protein